MLSQSVQKKTLFKILCASAFFYFWLFDPSLSRAAEEPVRIDGRHIWLLQPAPDVVMVSYMLPVVNPSKTRQKAEFPVLLPKNVLHFEAAGGLEKNELLLEADGSLRVAKTFAPATTILQINFVVSTRGSELNLDYLPPKETKELILMLPSGSGEFVASSQATIQKVAHQFGNQIYDMQKFEISGDQPIHISVGSLPEGRSRYIYLVFSLLVLLLASIGGYLLIKKKAPSDGTVDFLVNA